MLKRMAYLSVVAVLLFSLSACGKKETIKEYNKDNNLSVQETEKDSVNSDVAIENTSNIEKNNMSDKIQDNVNLIFPYTIATGATSLKNGKKVYTELEMISGEFYRREDRNPGGRMYDTNYSGTFQLRIYENVDDKINSTISVTELFPSNLYEDKFDLIFEDYNKDGNPDICMEQPVGYTWSEYTIYSIFEDGKVKAISPALSSVHHGPVMKLETLEMNEINNKLLRAGEKTVSGLEVIKETNNKNFNFIKIELYSQTDGEKCFRYYVWNQNIEKYELVLDEDKYENYPIFDIWIQKNTFLSIRNLCAVGGVSFWLEKEREIFDKYFTLATGNGDFKVESNYRQYQLNEDNFITKYNEKIKIKLSDTTSVENYYVCPKITGMLVMNGNNKSEEDYYSNSRAKKIKVTINGEKEQILELKDTMEVQLIDLEYSQISESDISVDIEVIDTYKGSKSNDIYISDIQFGIGTKWYGKAGTELLEIKNNENGKIYPIYLRNFTNGQEGDGDFYFYDDAKRFGWESWLTDGCSSWCSVWEYSNDVTASSTLASQGSFDYSPNNISSGERSNAWVEGVEGDGIGEYVEVTQMCQDGGEDIETDIEFTELCIVNGYAATQKNWEENNRVKELQMYFDDKYVGTLVLEDTIKPQYFDISSLKLKVANGEKAKFKFEIADVYKGNKYDDTCLTGLLIDFTRLGH